MPRPRVPSAKARAVAATAAAAAEAAARKRAGLPAYPQPKGKPAALPTHGRSKSSMSHRAKGRHARFTQAIRVSKARAPNPASGFHNVSRAHNSTGGKGSTAASTRWRGRVLLAPPLGEIRTPGTFSSPLEAAIELDKVLDKHGHPPRNASLIAAALARGGASESIRALRARFAGGQPAAKRLKHDGEDADSGSDSSGSDDSGSSDESGSSGDDDDDSSSGSEDSDSESGSDAEAEGAAAAGAGAGAGVGALSSAHGGSHTTSAPPGAALLPPPAAGLVEDVDDSVLAGKSTADRSRIRLARSLLALSTPGGADTAVATVAAVAAVGMHVATEGSPAGVPERSRSPTTGALTTGTLTVATSGTRVVERGASGSPPSLSGGGYRHAQGGVVASGSQAASRVPGAGPAVARPVKRSRGVSESDSYGGSTGSRRGAASAGDAAETLLRVRSSSTPSPPLRSSSPQSSLRVGTPFESARSLGYAGAAGSQYGAFYAPTGTHGESGLWSGYGSPTAATAGAVTSGASSGSLSPGRAVSAYPAAALTPAPTGEGTGTGFTLARYLESKGVRRSMQALALEALRHCGDVTTVTELCSFPAVLRSELADAVVGRTDVWRSRGAVMAKVLHRAIAGLDDDSDADE